MTIAECVRHVVCQKGIAVAKTKETYASQVATPELERMSAVKDDSHKLGEFIDWLREEKGWLFAAYHKHDHECNRGHRCELRDDELVPQHTSIEKLLAEYFEIDLDKVEKEKRELLLAVRKDNGEKNPQD